MDQTKIYSAEEFQDANIISTLKEVVQVLEERGYNPINQIVGYLMSGDPGYISSHKEARNKITKFDRTKLLEVLVRYFINQ
ncbi:MAG: IreB family regulatory phosphoprotein [Firmicutes bacterium]|nr:IreB family regulatory phosphoprotein [Bacillota bacterium]